MRCAQGVIRDREIMKVCLLTNACTQGLAAASLAAQRGPKSWPDGLRCSSQLVCVQHPMRKPLC